jgi:hypothetical protein
MIRPRQEVKMHPMSPPRWSVSLHDSPHIKYIHPPCVHLARGEFRAALPNRVLEKDDKSSQGGWPLEVG